MRTVNHQWLAGHPEREALLRDLREILLLEILLLLYATLLNNLLDQLSGLVCHSLLQADKSDMTTDGLLFIGHVARRFRLKQCPAAGQG